MATFVGVSLPEPPGPDIMSAPEGTTPWSIMGVWRSSLNTTKLEIVSTYYLTYPLLIMSYNVHTKMCSHTTHTKTILGPYSLQTSQSS